MHELRIRHRWFAGALTLALGAALAFASCRMARSAQPQPLVDHHVHVLSPQLVRDWKSLGVPFSRPDEHYTRLDTLAAIDELDGVLLAPMAHFYADEELRGALALDLDAERERVRAENDYVAELAASSAMRAVALASVDLLRPYALDELERARREHGVAGAKIHLRCAGFDLRNDEHGDALERVVAWVESFDGLMLLHLDTRAEHVESGDVAACLERAFGGHARSRVIVAHMGGSGGFDARTGAVLDGCLAWLESEARRGRPRPEFRFDLSAAILLRESEGVRASTDAEMAELGRALRRAGLERIVFGSDYPVFDPREHAGVVVDRLGLTPTESRRILSARVREFQRTAPERFVPAPVAPVDG